MKVHLPSRLSKCPENESVLITHGESAGSGSSTSHSVWIDGFIVFFFLSFISREIKKCGDPPTIKD